MSLNEIELRSEIERLFTSSTSLAPRTIGVELELIPVNRQSKKRELASATSESRPVAVLRQLGEHNDWIEEAHDDDPPSWKLPDGTCISFEPGGQIEISSAPLEDASSVVESTAAVVRMLDGAMGDAGVELLACGVDPYNAIDSVPLQLHRERYTRMTEYFETLGPSGVQMMRQTAALQINVERGPDPVGRWRLLNSLSPFVLALFANSSIYAGRETNWSSYRSYFWRTLDPSRTGVAALDSDAVQNYLDFALDAFYMRGADRRTRYRSFRECMAGNGIGIREWQFHLTTLFPEVRAKEYFELRSADTIEIQDLAAPIVFVTGLIYDVDSAQAAVRILPEPSLDLLERAGQAGLRDRSIHRLVARLAALALEGCKRMGESYLTAAHLEIAHAYFERKLALD